MQTYQKVADNHTVTGIFCDVRRGKSQNQRWSVYFRGRFEGRFNTKGLAIQVASHLVQDACRDYVKEIDSCQN
jgi:hypothetical protein